MRRVGEDLVKGQPNATDEALNINEENDVYLRIEDLVKGQPNATDAKSWD